VTPLALERCPSCEAPHGPEEAFCWMCRRSFWDDRALAPRPAPSTGREAEPSKTAPPPRPASAPAKPTPARPLAEDAWTQPVLIGAFILILAGLATGSGAGTALLWLGMIPAFFVTALSGFRPPKTQPKTFVEKLQRFVARFASVVAVMILAAAALVIALMAACFAVMAAMGLSH
jgi:hypothetical protein